MTRLSIDEGADLLEQVQRGRELYRKRLAGKLIVFASDKGGIGKTTEAVELAYLLGATLVDCDWHDGSASRSLGWLHEKRMKSPLLDAIGHNRVPRPILGGRSKPDLVAAGPDLEHNQPQPAVMTEWLIMVARELDVPIVVDTHPGGGPAANGAAAAGDGVIVPCPLKEKELEATAGVCAAMDGYPLILSPNMVPRIPPAAQLDSLASIAEQFKLLVTTPIPYATLFERRKARTAVCSARTLTAKNELIISAFVSMAAEVADRVA